MRKFIKLVRGSTLLAAVLLPILSARAQLVGAKVTHGSATFATSGGTTTVKAANNTVIQYSSFNIGTGQTVQFIQPTSKSQVLNWVSGSLPTNIFGTLLANGRVYIVNQEGVYFGPGALVNVGALYADAGSISTQDFLNGTNRFTANSGAVVNDGTISAHTVALVGETVTNRGSIIAPEGFVTLAAGEDVLIEEPDSAVFVTAQPSALAAAGTGVTNSGTINAEGGHALLAAGDVYSLAISQSGVVRGSAITLSGGAGTVDNSGTLDASSATATGGTVHVFGGNVVLEGTSVLDADGLTGGGAVLVGGGGHGKDPKAPDALTTTVDAGAAIEADATGKGNGGQVVVWSNDQTTFAGSISAQGDRDSGAGGAAEVSGGNLAYLGTTNLLGAPGKVGTLLLDPDTINIVSGGADSVAGGASFTTTGTSNIDPSAIVTTLATASVTLQANQDLTVENSIVSAGPGSLTLQAGRSLIIDANTDISVAGSFTGSANDVGATAAERGNGTATLTMGSNSLITAGTTISLTIGLGAGAGFNSSGALTLGGLSAGTGITVLNNNPSGTGGIVQGSGNLTSTVGTVDLGVAGAGGIGTTGTPIPVYAPSLEASAAGGSIYVTSLGATLTLDGITSGGGDISVNTSNQIDLGGAVSSGGGGITLTSPTLVMGAFTISAGAAGTVTLVQPIDQTTVNLATTATGGYYLSAAELLDITAGTLAIGTSHVTSLNEGMTTGALDLSTPNYNLSLTLGNSVVTPTTATFTSALTLGSGKSLTVTGGDSLLFNGNLTAGSLTTGNSTTTETFAGTLMLGSLSVGTGDTNVAFNGAGSAITSPVTLGNTGTLGFGSSSSTTFTGGLTATAPSAITTGGTIATTNQLLDLGNISLGANTTLGSGTGSLITGNVSGGAFGLTLASSGTLSLGTVNIGGALDQTGAATGSSTLGAVTASAITLAGTSFGGVSLTSAGNISVANSATSTFSGDLISAGGTIALGAVSVPTGTLVLKGSGLTLNGAISGPGSLQIEALANATTIGVNGGAGSLAITSGDITALGSTLAGVTLGTASSTGAVTIAGPVTFAPALTIAGTGATVSLSGALTGDAGLTIVPAVTLTTTGSLNSPNGALTVGAISANTGDSLTLQASSMSLTGAITGTATGTVTVEPVGAGTSIGIAGGAGTLSLTAGELGGITGFGTLYLGQAAGTGTTIIGGTLSLGVPLNIRETGGPVVVEANLTDSGGITIASPLSFDDVGAVTVQSGGTLTLGTITAGLTNLTLASASLALTGGANSVTGSTASTLTLQPLTTSTTIGINGGSGSLDITSTDLAAIAGGFAGVVIGQPTNSGTVAVSGTTTFNSPTTISGTGTVTVSGTVTDTGSLTIGAPVTVSGTSTVSSSGTLTLGSVSSTAASLTLAGTSLDLNGSVTGGSSYTLTIEPYSSSSAVTVNGAAGSFLPSTDLTQLTGFGSLVLGQPAGTNTITVAGTASLTIPLKVQGATTGSLVLDGSLGDTGSLEVDVPITLSAAAALTGTTLTLNSVSAGANALTLQTDSLTLNGGAGSITGTSGLTIEPATLSTAININTGTTGLIVPVGDFAFGGGGFNALTIGQTSDTGIVTIAGSPTFVAPLTIEGAAPGYLALTGSLTDSGGGLTLKIPLLLSGASTTLEANGVLTLDGGTDTSTNLTLEANSVVMTGVLTGGTTNTLLIEPFSASLSYTVNGAAGSFLPSTAVADLAGFQSLTLGQAAGTGTVTVVSGSTFDVPLKIQGTSGTVMLNGNLEDTGSLEVDLPVTLTGSATLAAGSGATLTLGNITAGGHALTLQADILNLSAAGPGGISGIGALTFTTATPSTSIGFNGGAGTLDIGSTVLGKFGTFTSLTLGSSSYTGTITYGGSFSLGVPFTVMGAAGSAFDISGTVNTNGEALTVGMPTVLTGNTTFDTGSATLTLQHVTGSAYNLTLQTNSLALTGGANSVVGTGILTLEPSLSSSSIGINDAIGIFNITPADIAAIAPGWASINIGSGSGTGSVYLASSSWSDPLIIESTTGPVFLLGNVTTTTGTNGYGVTISSNVTLAANSSIVTSGSAADGDITVDGSISTTSPYNLTLNSGTHGTGGVTVTGGIGSAMDPVGNLSVTTGKTLDQDNAWYAGNLSVTSSGAEVNLTDLSSVYSGTIALSSSTATAFTVEASGNVELGNVSLTNSGGSLYVLALDNDITQGAGSTINVAGASTFAADNDANNITLTNSGNVFGGAVSLVGYGSENNASVTSGSALQLGTVNLEGNLTINEGGGLTQSGSMTVGGNAQFNATASNTTITLTNSGNNFYDFVGVDATGFSGTAVSIYGASTLYLNTINLPGATSTLALSSGSDIFEEETINVGGASSISVTGAGGEIFLDEPGNTFGGPVSVSASGSGDSYAYVSNTGPLELDSVSLPNGYSSLYITAGGDITQTVAHSVSVSGVAFFEVTAPGSNIMLGNGTNLFNGTFEAYDNGDIAALAVGNATTSASIPELPTTLTTLTLNFPNSSVTLPGLTVTNLNITTGGGNLTESGPITVTNNTVLSVGNSYDIDLDTQSNNFANAVQILSARNVSLSAGGTLELANSTLAGNLSLTADNIMLSSDVVVGGSAVFDGITATSIGGNLTAGSITLAGNTELTGTGTQTIDATAGMLSVPGTLTKAAGDLTLEASGGISVHGNVDVTAGMLTVESAIETTGSLNAIGITLEQNATLDGPFTQSIDASTGTLTAMGNITKTGGGDLDLTGATLNLDGTVSSTGGIAFLGPLSFSGNLSANGLTLGVLTLTGTGTQTLDAGTGTLTLTGDISKTAGSLVLDGNTGIVIDNTLTIPGGSVTVNGPSTITGNIAANGINLEGTVTLTSTGLSTLNAGAGALDIGGSVNKAAGDLVLTGGGGVDLNGGASVGGSLTVNGLFTVGGDATANGLSFSGAILNGGATTLSGGGGVLVSNGNITKTTGGALTLSGGSVEINGEITSPDSVTFASPTTLSGSVTANGITFLSSATLTSGSLTLAAGGGAFVSTGVTLTAPGNLTLTGASGQLGSFTVGGTLFDNLLTSDLDGTYTASAFSFANTFNIAGTTDFVGPVSLGTGFNTEGHDLTFGGAVTLTAPITVNTGGNKIIFDGTLNGAEALTLDIAGGGSVSLLGNTGGITPLYSITTEGSGTLFVGGNITTNGHSQTYGTPVVLETNSVLTELNSGGEITFTSTLDGAKSGSESLSVNAQAPVTFGGLVGGTGPLSTLTTDAGGMTIISGGGVTTTGAQTYGDAVQLAKAGETLSTGGGALSLFSLDGNGENLTLATGSGATEVHGAVTNLGSGTGPALAFADGSTGEVTFDGTVAANGALNTPATVAAVFKGDVTIAQGGSQLLGSVDLDGVTFTTEGALTFGNLTLATGAVTVASSDGGAVTLGTVDGAQALTVTTTGMTTLGADVGGQAALSGLSISGPATVAGNITSTGGLTLGGAVTLSGTTGQTLAAGGGAFSSTGVITKAGTGAVDISSGTSVTAAGDITVAGALTLDAPSLTLGGNVTAVGLTATHGLTLNGSGTQTLAAGTGNLSVLGVTKAGGDLALSGADASFGGDISTAGGTLGISFTAITLGTDLKLSSGGGDLTLAGAITGPHALTVDAGSSNVDAGTASFGTAAGALTSFTVNGGTVAVGDVYTSGNQVFTYADKGVLFLDGTTYQASSGNIDLNSTSTPRTSIPDVATIVKANLGDLTIDAGGDFTMGVFEKMSVLGGNLVVDTNGVATLSDMSVAGSLTVKAEKYSLLIRSPSNVLVSTGEATDLGLDFVSFSAAFEDPTGATASGSSIGFNTASGSNNFTVRFATADGKASVPAYPGFSFYTLPSSYFQGELITSLLFGPLDNAYLTLRAIGFVRANVDSALPPTAPAAPIQVVSTYVVPAALRDDLVKLGIFARPDSDLVLQPFDPDAPIYDATIKSDDRSPERFEVADSRISSQNVLAAIRLYRQIFEERTADGRTRSRINEIQRVLATAYASYHNETGKTDPDAFRLYLEKNGGPALTYLNQLRDLVAKIGQVGLTPNEFSISKTYVLRSIRIPGMSLKALREAVAPEDSSEGNGRVTAFLFSR